MRLNAPPLFALPLLLACVGDVGEGKVKAEITDPPTAEKQATPAKGELLTIDTSASSVKALGAKITATHPIVFHTWEGTVLVDSDTLTDLDFSIDVASLEADHPKLTGHLKNEDFLWVDKHPKATFDATEVKVGSSAEGMTHTVTGDLQIRGETKRVTFPAKVDFTEDAVVANTEFTIDRQDFGVTYKGRADDLVQDNVVLTIAFKAPKAPTEG